MAAEQDVTRRENYECFILALTILSLANLMLLIVMPHGETENIIRTVDMGISAVLMIDFWLRLMRARSKSRYFFHDGGYLDLIGSFPVPVLRVARLYRVYWVSRSLRPVRRRIWRTVLQDRAGSTLLAVLFLVVLLMEVASALVLSIEIESRDANIKTASDALWWTWVSVMTVGYGDRYPVTNSGRWVGVFTIAVGVGLFGALTGFLANAFLRPNARLELEARQRDEQLMAELAALRAEVHALLPRADAPPESAAVTPADVEPLRPSRSNTGRG